MIFFAILSIICFYITIYFYINAKLVEAIYKYNYRWLHGVYYAVVEIKNNEKINVDRFPITNKKDLNKIKGLKSNDKIEVYIVEIFNKHIICLGYQRLCTPILIFSIYFLIIAFIK